MEEDCTSVISVVLLEACHELRAMGEKLLLQGPESRAFSNPDPASTRVKTRKCILPFNL